MAGGFWHRLPAGADPFFENVTRLFRDWLKGIRPLALIAMASLGGCGELRPAPENPYFLRHRVQAGETLYSIAWGLGYDYRELAAWNGIAPPYRIFPGQELVVLAPDPRQVREVAPPPARNEDAAPGRELAGATPADGHPAVTGVAQTQPAGTRVQTETWVPLDTERAATPPSPERLSTAEGVAKPGQGKKRPHTRARARAPSEGKSTQAKGKARSRSTRGKPGMAAGIKWRWPTEGRLLVRFSAAGGRKGIDLGGKPGQPVRAAADGEVVYSGSGLIGYGKLIIIRHNDVFLSAYGFNRRLLVKEGDRVKAGKIIAEMGQSPKTGSILHFEIRRNGKPVDPLLYLPNQTS